MNILKHISVLFCAALISLSGCASKTASTTPPELGKPWVSTAAEYNALTLQAYQNAARNLDALIADTSWSALPGQKDFSTLPPAIILDVDETAVSNIEFQLQMTDSFSHEAFDFWHMNNKAGRMLGAPEFLQTAKDKGVEIFFITNRPCKKLDFAPGACPQKAITLQDITESGITTDLDHLMLVGERPEWDREKRSRQELIGKTHRVIMLFGDDLGDFIPCVRAKPVAPCPAASAEDRDRLTLENSQYWGIGWYILPNPMHGSWTSFIESGNPED